MYPRALGESAQDSPYYDPYTGRILDPGDDLTPTIIQTQVPPDTPPLVVVGMPVNPTTVPATLPDLIATASRSFTGVWVLLGVLGLAVVSSRGRGSRSWL